MAYSGISPQRSPLARALISLGVALLVVLQCAPPADASPVRVRYAEGVVHGFLVLKDGGGRQIAHGDLIQTASAGVVDTRVLFHFRDGSFLQERVTFTQSGTFRMRNYSFEMRGPTFPSDQKITLERSTGKYRVESAPRDGKPEVIEGTLELPEDTYNGMIMVIAKNLTKVPSTRVHFVAFRPKPMLVELDIVAASTQKVSIGGAQRNTVHFVVKPQLGGIKHFFAKLLGKLPPDNHLWILSEQVPAFVRAESFLYNNGPVWRIELAAPRWPG
jgi:hypothetical protein